MACSKPRGYGKAELDLEQGQLAAVVSVPSTHLVKPEFRIIVYLLTCVLKILSDIGINSK